MVTTKTRADLVERAMRRLGVVGAGESPAADDSELVDAMVDGLFADLSETNVYGVSDEDEIPVSAFEWLSICLADTVAVDFGKASDAALRQYAEARLRRLAQPAATGQPQRAEYL